MVLQTAEGSDGLVDALLACSGAWVRSANARGRVHGVVDPRGSA
ncbi:hypothetical protein ACGFIF_33660 [Kribbella sp. NPDC049174]